MPRDIAHASHASSLAENRPGSVVLTFPRSGGRVPGTVRKESFFPARPTFLIVLAVHHTGPYRVLRFAKVEVAYASSPTRRGQLVTEAGILEHTYAYGLGSGIALNADIGGEVRGWGSIRADGIWLYQFDIGKAIHRELTKAGASTSWVEIYNKKARQLSAANAPLHHFGGYEMFTWEQWLAQAQVLLEPLRPSLRRSVLEVGVGAGAFVAAIRAFTDENPDTVDSGLFKP